MISASTQDQSGQGSATTVLRPLLQLAKDTRASSIKAGAPAVGTLPGDADVHYVDGTPGMAVLYAIDQLAPQQWHKRPGLVISGPNYGNNLGAITVGSGTVAAALFAINRDIPAIAVSDSHHYYRNYTQLRQGDIDYEIADIVVRLVARLETEAKNRHKPLLPQGIGLNVNIPSFAPGSGSTIQYRLTRLGRQTGMYFSDDLSQDLNVMAMGINFPAAPGISYAIRGVPAGLKLPLETKAIKQNVVTVSVMQGIPQAGKEEEREIRRRIKGLLSSTP